MKNKELIAILQQYDPDIEVCVDNYDIYFVDKVEAYWDGRLQRLVLDESKKPHYHVVGAKVACSGWKLRLHTMGVSDVLLNDPDAPVDLSDLEKNMTVSYQDWKKRVEKERQRIKNIEAEIATEQK
jgi:hypothetical protein